MFVWIAKIKAATYYTQDNVYGVIKLALIPMSLIFLCLVFTGFFYNFLQKITNLPKKSLFIGEAKTQKQIAENEIILSRDFKATFKQNLKEVKKTQ